MGESTIPELTGATVEREIKTQKGNRIDLQILGGDWCLIVENKIWHIQNNPFDDYETHAKRISKLPYFAILSPDGKSCQSSRWKGISYAKYCMALRQHFGKTLFDTPHSKWHLFAREFILHIENELYNPTMNTDQADFVEQHEEQIQAVKKLDSEYRLFLQALLKQTLDEKIPEHTFWTKDENWAIRCYSNKWGQPNLALWKQDGKFMVTAYLVGLTKDQLFKAHDKFSGLKFVTEGASWVYWVTQHGFDSRDEAIKELCRLANIIADLFQVPPEPTAGVPV